MALTTANGGAVSDSYATVSQADDYLTRLYGADNLGTWADLTTFQKEYRLRIAAQLLGLLPLRGRRSYANQALDFPRYVPEVSFNNPRKVPGPVVEAQILIAFGIVHRGLANESSPDDGVAAGRVKSVGLSGLLSVSFADGPTTGGTVLGAIIRNSEFPVYSLLRPWMIQLRMHNIKTADEEVADYLPVYTTSTTLYPEATTSTAAPVTTTTAAPTTTTT